MTVAGTSIRRIGGKGGVFLNMVTLTLDSSYTTGGVAITPDMVGLSSINELFALEAPAGWTTAFDSANSKLIVFGSGGGGVLSITKTCPVASFTDNLNTTGFIDFTASSLPIGAIPVSATFRCTAGFAGDVSATWKLGISGDLDRYSAVTSNSCFTAITTDTLVKNTTALQGTQAAQTPRLTITTSTDFTLAVSNGTGTGVATLNYMTPRSALVPMAQAEAANGTDLSLVTVRCLVAGQG